MRAEYPEAEEGRRSVCILSSDSRGHPAGRGGLAQIRLARVTENACPCGRQNIESRCSERGRPTRQGRNEVVAGFSDNVIGLYSCD